MQAKLHQKSLSSVKYKMLKNYCICTVAISLLSAVINIRSSFYSASTVSQWGRVNVSVPADSGSSGSC